MSNQRRHRGIRTSRSSSTSGLNEPIRPRRHGDRNAQVLNDTLNAVDEASGFESNPNAVSPVVPGALHIGSLAAATTTTLDHMGYSTAFHSTSDSINYYPDVDDSPTFDSSAYQQAAGTHYRLPIQYTASTFPTGTYPAHTLNGGGWVPPHSNVQDDDPGVYHATGPSSPMALPGNGYSHDLSAHGFDQGNVPTGYGAAQNVTYQAETSDWYRETPERRWSTQVEQGSDEEADGRRSPEEPAPQNDDWRRGYRSAEEPHGYVVLSGYLNDEEAPFYGVGGWDVRRSRINSVLEDDLYGL